MVLSRGALAADTTGSPADHLKCFDIKDTNSPGSHKVVLFTPQFQHEETCRVQTKAEFMCVETKKLSVDGQSTSSNFPPAGDFLCYHASCKPPISRNVLAFDQFNNVPNRLVTIKKALYLCAPARKEPAPPLCGDTAPTCNGLCDSASQQCVVQHSPTGAVRCVCQ